MPAIREKIEAQLQYTALPGNPALDLGAACLIHGRFLEEAPNAPNEGDTTYIYMATF